MGSCSSSVQKNPDSAMKINLSFVSKTKKLFTASPPRKEKTQNGEHTIGDYVLSREFSTTPPVKSFRDFGSKEETFFDSQPWLDSDCEDFHSVNGDFTPSRGSTPKRLNSFPGTPQRGRSPFLDRAPIPKPETSRAPIPKPETSPTDKKKKLLELFRDSRGGDDIPDYQTIPNNHNIGNGEVEATNLDLPPKSANGTPYLSETNSFSSSAQTTPNRHFIPEKEKSIKRCLPNFIPSCRSHERKKKMSPIHAAEG